MSCPGSKLTNNNIPINPEKRRVCWRAGISGTVSSNCKLSCPPPSMGVSWEENVSNEKEGGRAREVCEGGEGRY